MKVMLPTLEKSISTFSCIGDIRTGFVSCATLRVSLSGQNIRVLLLFPLHVDTLKCTRSALFGRCGGLLKEPELFCCSEVGRRLTSESVQSTALAFQSVDDVHGCDCLALGVLGVSDGIADHVLQEHLEDTASLFVDQTRNTLDTSSASQTTDGRLGDTLDVITKYFPVTLSAPLSKTFSSLAATRHFA